jgi:release factor glutamine methyltransferase
MLPTPDTSHVAFERVYEPAEDSYLLLDTLSAEGEKAFLHDRFSLPSQQDGKSSQTEGQPTPVVAEIGTGSGVVLAFVNAHVEIIFGRSDIITIGVDVNRHACQASQETVRIAAQDQAQKQAAHGCYLENVVGDLTTPLRPEIIDVLIFNPPYVPTPELPDLPTSNHAFQGDELPSFDEDSHLLSLSYAGGTDGMETTDKLLSQLPEILSVRGVAYILLCAQNKPEVVKERIRAWQSGWMVETVGSSGKKAGWEKLQIIRIWRNISAAKLKPL